MSLGLTKDVIVWEYKKGDIVRGAQGDSNYSGVRGEVQGLFSIWFPGVYYVQFEGVPFLVRVRWDHMMLESLIESDEDYRKLYEHRLQCAKYEYPRSF